MRVLHVVNDADTGGAQTLIESLALRADGSDEVHLLVLMNKGVLSRRLEKAAKSVTYIGLTRRSVNLFRPIFALRRLIRDLRIEVVHSHLLQSDLVCLAAFLAIPHVSTIHTSGSHESNKVAAMVSRIVALWSPRFTKVVACTNAAKVYAVERCYSDAGSYDVVPNGTAIPSFVPGAIKNRSFLSLSRWHPMKDHETLISAFALFLEEHPGWALVCAGNEVHDSNLVLKSMINEQGLTRSVELVGSVGDINPLLESASGLILSSSHGEALPMAGIEALAHGVPVITTDVGDCSSLVTDGDFLVAPKSPTELSAAMSVLAQMTELAYEGARRASWSLASEKFDSTITAKRYRKIYSDLVARTQQPSR